MGTLIECIKAIKTVDFCKYLNCGIGEACAKHVMLYAKPILAVKDEDPEEEENFGIE